MADRGMPGENQPSGSQPRPRRARREFADAAHLQEARAEAAAAAKAAAKRRRAKTARRVLAGFTVVVLACVAFVGFYVWQLTRSFDEQRNVLELELEDDTAYRTSDDVINILLLGSDSREDDTSYRESIGQEGERSDTMMFVHIPEDRSGVYVMSIVRDLWVDIPGQGEDRVNAALGAGGEELVIDTVEELLDTHIDHIVIIDFEGFSDLTTALGGVYVDNPRSFSSGVRNPSYFPEGTIRLEGSDALRFVRERKAFLEGDFIRVQNQQLVVGAIIDRFLSAETLTNPQRIMDVVDGIVPYLYMDEGLDSGTVASYGMEMRNLRSSDIHMFTVPTGDLATTAGGAEVVLQDEQAMAVLQQALKDEDMDRFLEYIELREAGEPVDDFLPEEEELGDPYGTQDSDYPDDYADPGLGEDDYSDPGTGVESPPETGGWDQNQGPGPGEQNLEGANG